EITTASFDDLLSRPIVDLLGGVKLKKAPFECAIVPLLLRIRSQLGSWPASEKEFGEQISSVTASSTDTAMAKFLEPILSEPRLLQQISAGAIPPCAAVVGGLLGQEVVKVVTRRDEPLVNTGIGSPNRSSSDRAAIEPRYLWGTSPALMSSDDLRVDRGVLARLAEGVDEIKPPETLECTDYFVRKSCRRLRRDERYERAIQMPVAARAQVVVEAKYEEAWAAYRKLSDWVTYSCRTNGAHVEKMPAKGTNEVTAVKDRHATGAENDGSSALVATVLEEDEAEGEEPMELD
ncbi:hypothetical protein FOZ62_021392, partial [Perkinsus olseni]